MLLWLVTTFVACDLGGLFDENISTINEANNIDVIEEQIKKKEEASEKEEEMVSYQYTSNSKRDPFLSFLGGTTGPDGPTNPKPLQKYAVDKFRLTAIIWGIERPRAVLEDPEGIGHVIELGSYVGPNWGKVETIDEDVVIVSEERTVGDGQIAYNKLELRLGKPN